MRTQSICLAVASVLLCPFASAQWVQTNGPYGGRVTALGVSGMHLFAGIENAGVYRSTDNGKRWIAVNSGLTNKNVVSLAATSNGIGEPNIFAGTVGGGIFRSSDNGMNWTEINSGLPGMQVSCLTTSPNEKAGTDLFACMFSENPWGANIFRSTNNGTSWMQINTELLYPFIDALAVVGTDLFVGASWGGGLLRFTDNDTSWVVDTLLTSISVRSLAVSGDSLFAGTSDGVFLFADNDTSCIQVNSGLPSNTYVYTLAVSGTNLFANTGLGGVYLSTNSGLSWSLANTGLSPNGWPYISAFASIGTNIFAGTLGDGVFLSTDNGKNWTPTNTGIPDTYVYAFGVVPTGTEQSNLLVSTGDRIHFSTDNGLEWTLINKFTDYGVFCFLVVPNDTGGINIFAGGNGVFLSTDVGLSWTSKGLTNTRVFSFAVIGSNLFAGTEDRGVYLSTNNGASWSEVNEGLPRSNWDANRYVGIRCSESSGQNLFAGTDGGVMLSTNNGENWTTVNNGLPKDEYGNYFISDLAASGSNLFVGTGNGGVFLSTDNGASWHAVTAGLTNSDVMALAISPDGTNLFAGTSGGVFLSTNNGTSWTEVNSGLPPNTYVTELAVSGNNLFAGTLSSGVWRRAFSEMITLVDPVASQLPHEFVLQQNYPNPFNPSTTIRYGLPYRSHVTLAVFNTLGQQVALLQNGNQEAGYHEVRFDGSGLSSGVYFYRIEAGSFVQTRKLLLIR